MIGGDPLELVLEQPGARDVELARQCDHGDVAGHRCLEAQQGHAAKPTKARRSVTLVLMARLRRADCSGPGIRRVKRGRGFSYVDEDGEPVDEPEVLAASASS